MRWVQDRTGRFRWRPWYEPREIDDLCEQSIVRFLQARHGVVSFPVSTDDLTLLIEQEASDLDIGADLAGHGCAGATVEGITTFYHDRPPRVQIDRALTLDPQRQARLRTTLAHEFGHVLLHDFARYDTALQIPAPDIPDATHPVACTPSTLSARTVDWMEWQANYACGALLIPHSAVRAMVESLADTERRIGLLVDRLQERFLVSEAAAFVRMRQLGSSAAAPLSSGQLEG